MADLQFKTRSGANASIPEATLTAFKEGLRGRVAVPGSADYEQARPIWNAMIERRPALFARCAGAADVMRSVHFAREQGLPLAVRGGGHNIAGNALCDGGLVIDLSPMKSVRIDAGARLARVEPGVTLASSTARRRPSGWPRRWASTPP